MRVRTGGIGVTCVCHSVKQCQHETYFSREVLLTIFQDKMRITSLDADERVQSIYNVIYIIYNVIEGSGLWALCAHPIGPLGARLS